MYDNQKLVNNVFSVVSVVNKKIYEGVSMSDGLSGNSVCRVNTGILVRIYIPVKVVYQMLKGPIIQKQKYRI